jgi:hypothetical protein
MDLSPQELWNCAGALEFRCPARWEHLEPTADADIRHCTRCEKDVYWSPTPEDFVRHGEQRRCVAVPAAVAVGQVGMSWVGRPDPERVRARADQQRALAAWWAAVFALGPSFHWPGMSDARFWAFQPDGDTNPKAAAE